jgi:hypothetical protein
MSVRDRSRRFAMLCPGCFLQNPASASRRNSIGIASVRGFNVMAAKFRVKSYLKSIALISTGDTPKSVSLGVHQTAAEKAI